MIILAVATIAALAIHRPGFTLAISLLIGRQAIQADFSIPAVTVPLIALVGLAIHRHQKLLRPPVFVWLPLLLFSIAAIARPVFDTSETGSLGPNVGFYVLGVVLPLTFVAQSLGDRLAFRRDFAISTVGISLALTAIAFVTSNGSRAGALGGGPITLAQSAALGAVLLLSNFGNVRSLLPRVVSLAFIAILSAGVVWTQSRGPTAALAIAFGLYFANLGARRIPPLRLVVVGAFMAGSTVGLSRLGLLPRRLARLTSFNEEISRSRGIVWNPALEVISDHPMLGCGLDCYFRATDARFTYPHNIFLEAFVVGGILLFLVVLWACFRLVSAVAKQNSAHLPVIIVPLVSSLLSGDFFNNRALWVIGVLLLITPARPSPAPGPSYQVATA